MSTTSVTSGQPVTLPTDAALPEAPSANAATEVSPNPAVPADIEDTSTEDDSRATRRERRQLDPEKAARREQRQHDRIAATILGSEYLDLASGMTAFGIERSLQTPFPSLPMPNFGTLRTQLTPTEDLHLRVVENINGHTNNIFNAINLISPPRFDTQSQGDFTVLSIDPALDAWRAHSITRGMMTYTGNNLGFRASHTTYAGAEYLIASEHLQRLRLSLPNLNEDEPYDQTGMQDLIDAMNGEFVPDADGLVDLSSAFSMPATPLHSAIGQDRVRLATSAGLMFQSFENESGRPTFYSLIGAGVVALDLGLQNLGDTKLKPAEYGERLALAGGAFAVESILTDDNLAQSVHNNYSYAAMGVAYPKILFYGFSPEDGPIFESDNYQSNGNIFGLTSAATEAFYLGGSAWAGYHAGRGLAVGTNSERYMPLILGGVGLGSQVVSNVVAGSPDNWKHIGLGAASLGLGTLAGYFLHKNKKPKTGPVAVDFGFSGTGAQIGVSGTLGGQRSRRSDD